MEDTLEDITGICRLPEKWGARVGEADAQDKLDALLAALDAQAGGEEAP